MATASTAAAVHNTDSLELSRSARLGLSIEDIAVTAVYVAMITAILFGNSLVVLSFVRHRSLRTTTNVFLINVAAADILTGLTSALLALILRVVPGASSNYTICVIHINAVLTTVGASNIFVVTANLDRYVAIHWPFHYDKFVRRRVSIIVGGWTFFMVIGLLPVFGWNDFKPGLDCDFISVMALGLCFIVVIVYMSMFFILLFLNVRIFWTARRQAKRIASEKQRLNMPSVISMDRDSAMRCLRQPITASQRSRTSSVCEESVSSTSGGSTTHQRALRRVSRANIKAARVVAIVVGVYGLCHFPSACVIATQLILRLQGHDPHSLYVVFSYIIILTFLNSGMNPLIYYITIPGFRGAYKRLLCPRIRRRRRSHIDLSLYA